MKAIIFIFLFIVMIAIEGTVAVLLIPEQFRYAFGYLCGTVNTWLITMTRFVKED